MQKIKFLFPHYISSLFNSYSQIFFSNNLVFAIILFAVTFFDFYAGLSGVIAVTVSNTIAYLLGLNRGNIKLGYYGFNSLLVGLGLGVCYNPNIEYFMLLFFASLFTLLITVALEGIIGKYGLPYLSISFLISLWLITIASREFNSLIISDRGIYTLNEMYIIGGLNFVKLYIWFNNLNLPDFITLYFRSLGAIFFQYHLFAGLLVAIGILIYSRIAFILSIFGFGAAYIFYQIIGGNITELSYGYIGFNFILSAIAIGGFFIVSSKYSFLWVLLLTPIISILITATGSVLSLLQLSVFSLPFNIIVITFLYILKFRERYFNKPEIVNIQYFSPEINLYTQKNNKGRFKYYDVIPVSLPFWGEWKVTQGHNGKLTHKADWRHAWDFEIVDENKKYFTGSGLSCSDYYCFNKPIVAPAAGWVEQIQDYIEDNRIGEVNTEKNWGNTIIIKHNEKLYSKISHIEKDSFKVNVGDYIKKGDVIANCGNSGRSPQPHIHFQFQTTPFIGSKTLDYPIGHYIVSKDDEFILHSYERPIEGEIVSNIVRNNSLIKAYHFTPGERITFEVTTNENSRKKIFNWEIQINIFNQTLIYCENTGSKAYFINDGEFHCFTGFEGNKKSLLYYFYLANYKVMTGFYKNLKIIDKFPLNIISRSLLMTLQDFVSPFAIFINSNYELTYISKKDDFINSEIVLNSVFEIKVAKYVCKNVQFKTTIVNNIIDSFTINQNDKVISVKRLTDI